ncbi:hypothetical protein JTE90_015073 [Oedothorax gibbosus]|uniref:Uncharacterized protein n=1 Tax=Oedothorax gibbosus TaxID=931172 RepID=A0AAV6VSX9_9ARAC|nr:hypothetical protein JTE90_015073 [Oedothorax gibbosus]
MADVFLTEELEDCADDDNESNSISKMTVVEAESEENTDVPQILLNDNDEEVTEDQSSESNSDMILKEETIESELFEAEDLMVNPDDLLPPVVKLEKYANSEIVFNR